MPIYKPGAQLRSAVDETEVVVVQANQTEAVLGCGGSTMVPRDEPDQPSGAADPELSDGTQLGKRYADDATGLEVLVTRPGTGTLTVGDAPMQVKQAKPLPSSD